jgi:hypothetical protein
MFEALALATVGSSLISGALGSEASKEASEIGAGAADRASNLTMANYRTTRADLSPWRLSGEDALRRLMHLTGVGGVGPTLAHRGATDLVDMAGGVPSMNQRYANDPMYVQAWQEIESGHRAREGGRGYTAQSTPASIASKIAARLRSEADANREMGAARTGAAGDPEYGSLMKDFSLADFARDPGYMFRLEEGEKALTRGAAARGLAKSSPGLRSLMRFNQDLASSEFAAAHGRFEGAKAGKFNLLSYLSGGGQNAAAMTGTAGTNAAAGAAQAIMAGGNAGAAGAIGSASAWNNAIQGGLGNYMYQQRFDQMMKRMPVFGSPGAGGVPPLQLGGYTGFMEGG